MNTKIFMMVVCVVCSCLLADDEYTEQELHDKLASFTKMNNGSFLITSYF